MTTPELWSGEIRQQAAQHRSSDAGTVFWLSTDGRYGWVSAQLDPRYMFDAEAMLEQAMLEQAMQLASLAANVMVKVPGTVEGYVVIQQLVRRSISINNTLTYPGQLQPDLSVAV